MEQNAEPASACSARSPVVTLLTCAELGKGRVYRRAAFLVVESASCQRGRAPLAAFHPGIRTRARLAPAPFAAAGRMAWLTLVTVTGLGGDNTRSGSSTEKKEGDADEMSADNT